MKEGGRGRERSTTDCFVRSVGWDRTGWDGKVRCPTDPVVAQPSVALILPPPPLRCSILILHLAKYGSRKWLREKNKQVRLCVWL